MIDDAMDDVALTPSPPMGLHRLPRDGAGLIAHWLSGKSPETVRAYRGDLQALAQHLGLDASDPGDAASHAADAVIGYGQAGANSVAIAWRGAMLDADVAPATVNRRLSSLRSIVKLARLLGLVTWNLDVGNTRSRKYRDTSGPGVPVVRSMISAAEERGDAKGMRDRALVSLIFHLGLRRAEVSRLDLEDLDRQKGVLTITGKGRREEEQLEVPEPTLEVLEAWIAVRGEHEGALFTTFAVDKPSTDRLTPCGIWIVVREWGRAVGEQVAPHGIRHTAITKACELAAKAGLPLPAVLPYSRHADLGVLQLYVDNAADLQGRIARMVADDPDQPKQLGRETVPKVPREYRHP
ncbi:MAG: tyrosine-type recombinase/integrase [Planctomycetota bacterium]